MEIKTSKTDIVWNYIGTAVTMSSGFILLPLLLVYLSGDELGLWYVFLAISSLTQLFQWGFEPTFARNVVYVLSGARKLTKEGCDAQSMEDGVDWHLLRTVFKAAKVVFGLIAVASTAIMATIGSVYVGYISAGMPGFAHWVAWAIFVAAIFLNLYFLYPVTFLRGTGDVAGENRSTTVAKICQLAISAVLLVLGMGLVGAALGFLANGVLTRVMAFHYLRKHGDVAAVCASRERVERSEVREVLEAISFVSLRNCATHFASYASTQASTILCSLFLSLADTGLFSVSLQLGNAVCNFAAAYFRTFMPALQSAYSAGNTNRARRIVSNGLTVFWVLILLGTVAVPVAVFPLVQFLRPDIVLDTALFTGMSAYLALNTHCSLMTGTILSANYIPFMKAYVISSLVGIALSAFLMSLTPVGIWGLVLGLSLSQFYNFWKWPHWVMKSFGTTYHRCIKMGLNRLINKIRCYPQK